MLARKHLIGCSGTDQDRTAWKKVSSGDGGGGGKRHSGSGGGGGGDDDPVDEALLERLRKLFQQPDRGGPKQQKVDIDKSGGLDLDAYGMCVTHSRKQPERSAEG